TVGQEAEGDTAPQRSQSEPHTAGCMGRGGDRSAFRDVIQHRSQDLAPSLVTCRWSSTGLVEPACAPDLTPQRKRLPELDPDHSPRLRAPPRVQHRAQDAVDAEPGVPEAGVGVDHLSATIATRSASTTPRSTAIRSRDREIALAISANGGTLRSDPSSHWRVYEHS